MGTIVVIVAIFLILGAALGAVAFVVYRRQLRRAKGIERGLKMVPIIIHLPPPSDDTEGGSRDVREVMREKTSQAEVLYNLIAGTAQNGFKSQFYGQRHVALELIATNGLIHFYAAVPVALVSVVEQAILTSYPGAHVEEVEDHNIFNQEGRIAATMGGEILLKSDTAYPIATFKQLDRDPMEAILNTLGTLQTTDGAGIQIMLRPASPDWVKRSVKVAYKKSKSHHIPMQFTARDFALAAVRPPEESDPSKNHSLTDLEKNAIEAIEEKTQHPGYEVLIRVVVSTASVARSQTLLRDISNAFALYESPGLNGFKFLPAVDSQGLVTAFIFRFFPPEVNSMVLNSVELATLYHLPDKQFTPSTGVERQQSKQVDGPTTLAKQGLLFGYNEFRGVRKEIRLSEQDRRRHTYILGQTGTGKSTMLENLAVQDMRNGGGFAFIDPHGETAEKLMAMVPKERAEDVVYFNPADTEYPLGLNLFEFDPARPEQKDFLIQETIGMLTKLYDPNGTGVIGPRFEQWYRNAALTLMSDPNGSTFIEIPKVFSDTEYLKRKFRYLKDPTVIEFWTKEMGQTSDYHKSEMLGYFVSKFGAFQQNEMMRNIIGQTKSAFDLRDIMDNKKILIVNLSKGRVGELNSRLLGMIFVIKIQAAAMARADIPEIDRKDFSLYVDEFQNFSTDSFATILSEARKYRLNLIVANQFIGQLSNEIRDAVFGNVGTILAHRMGPEDAEFMVKQFAPVFDTRDLVNIPNYHSVVRLMNGGLPSQPFSMSNLPALGSVNLELGKAMEQLSSAKFGVSRVEVEADIFSRLSGKPVAMAPAAPAPRPAPAVAAPAPAPVPQPVAAPIATVPEPVTPTLDAVMAPAPVTPAPAPTPVPAPVAAPAKVDPSSLSFKDITGRDTLYQPEAQIAPAVAAAPVMAAVAAPAPVVPTPDPTPALMAEPVVAPEPVPVPVPAPADVAPAAAPVFVKADPIIPEDDEVEAPSVSVLESVAIEPATAPVIPMPASVPAIPEPAEPTGIHTIPLIPEAAPAPIPAVAPTPVAVVEPIKINTEHRKKHPTGRPDVPKAEAEPEPVVEVIETPTAPIGVPAPKVGRPNHTTQHVEGRPEAPVVAAAPAPVEAPVPVPAEQPQAEATVQKSETPSTDNSASQPRNRKSKAKRMAERSPADEVGTAEVNVVEPDDTKVPTSDEQAQDEIEKLIDPDHHLHLFPEKKIAPKVTMADLSETPAPEPAAAPVPPAAPIETSAAPQVAAPTIAEMLAQKSGKEAAPQTEPASLVVEETIAPLNVETPALAETTPAPIPVPPPGAPAIPAASPEPTPEAHPIPAPEAPTQPIAELVAPTPQVETPVTAPVAAAEPELSPQEQEKSAAELIAKAMKNANAALTSNNPKPEEPVVKPAPAAMTIPPTAENAPVAPTAEEIPPLAPGEIYVDASGIVHTGS